MELRTLATLINEETMLKAYEEGLDIHRLNASLVLNKPMEEVTTIERVLAKGVSFGLLYRKSAESFVRTGEFKNITEATNFFNSFFNTYPKIKEYFDTQDRMTLELNGVRTFYGDVIPLTFNPRIEYEVAAAQREATNYPIQHYASCSTALTILKLEEVLKEKGLDIRSFGFVHDASDLSISIVDFKYIANNLRNLIINIAKDVAGLIVDIDFSIGTSLGEQVTVTTTDNENVFKLDGTEHDVYKLLEALEKKFILTFSVDSEKEKQVLYDDLFYRGAFNLNVGKFEKIITGTLTFL